MKFISNGRGDLSDGADISAVICGTMVSSDLARARRFYEDFLGFECVRHAPGRMLLRDSHSADLMRRGERGGLPS